MRLEVRSDFDITPSVNDRSSHSSETFGRECPLLMLVAAPVMEVKSVRNKDIKCMERISFGVQLRFENLDGCSVTIPTCEATLIVRNCSDTIFIVSCSQLRIDSSQNCVFCVYSYSPPVMENSSHLDFHPYPGLEIASGITLRNMWSSGGNALAVSEAFHFSHPSNAGLRHACEKHYLRVKDYTMHLETTF
ncbi:Tubulin binding cofactor C-like domain containing protein [Perkinsela sp. CCAP 1560/4]|nr:Tubulin binding cofactor C-like domain [Perkinsela sp. CCAP 1560/4]KNH04794.1 Tubulin binding cofactor C-like domain containing protein [Perkinsela sp. CCAP 1560/4]|eukprot:KNH00538.1 Tubulin binding cofactor C-like domain [Perkinsela sp. CCAP 1560/4]